MPYSNPSKKGIFLNLLNGQVANEMNSNKVILVAVVPRRSGIGSKNVVPWRINVGQHNIHFITGKRNPQSVEKQCNGAAVVPPTRPPPFLSDAIFHADPALLLRVLKRQGKSIACRPAFENISEDVFLHEGSLSNCTGREGAHVHLAAFG